MDNNNHTYDIASYGSYNVVEMDGKAMETYNVYLIDILK